MGIGQKLARNTRHLQSLPIGTPVAIQNHSGRYLTKWDKTGVITEVRSHEQIVVKVDGSRRLTLRYRRFVRELDPGKTSLEDRQPAISATPPQTPRPGRMRRYVVTPPPWSPPSSATPTPSQPTAPNPVDEFTGDTVDRNIEELPPVQIDDGDDCHDGV